VSKTILFVDDEKLILRSLKRIFLQSQYSVFIAESGDEALKILDSKKIDMIISDIKMPDMNGYELLQIVKSRYPATIRLVLSGYADESIIVKLIHGNVAKMCIYKPWENEKLIKTIDQVFYLNDILTSSKILNIIKNVDNLPALNYTYTKLNSLINKDCNLEDVEKIIEKDQAIATNLLRLINSAHYGTRTGNLRQAIAYLGLNTIKNIALATSLFEEHKNLRIGLIFDANFLWQHADLTNTLASYLYEKIIFKKIPLDYSYIGLLHNIGKLILINNFPKEYDNIILMVVRNPNKFLYIAEKEVIGISHQEIGSYLLNWWGLPYVIVETALYHHTPSNSNVLNKEIVSIIHVASYYSYKLLNVNWGNSLDINAFNILGVTKEYCEKIISELPLHEFQ